jgi:competence protein CoiA
MLTALTIRQKTISLTRLSLQEIILLKRQRQEFFCPACRGPLIIKAGELKIPHFAHKPGTLCKGHIEPETLQHLQGKILLYQQFSSFIPHVTLEHYLADIQQRPDIFIQFNHRSFALEYQCSSISNSDFTVRTKGYLNAGIEPVWILGERVKTKGSGAIVLSNFQQNFIRFSPHAGYWLAFFNSLTKNMHFYFNLSPLSATIFTSVHYSLPLASIPFPFQLPLNDSAKNQFKSFFDAKEGWLKNKLKFNRGVNDPFMKSLYLNRDHILNLPDFVGLPTEHMLLFKSHPVEWQYYIWADVFKEKENGCIAKLDEISKCLDKRMTNGTIRWRNLPLIDENLRRQAVEQYLLVLEKRDIIKKVNEEEYLLLQTHT